MSDAVDDGPWSTVDHARRQRRRQSIPRDAFSFVSHFFLDVLDIVEKVTISNDSSVGVLAIDAHVVQRFEIVLFALLFPEAFEILLRITPFFVLRFQPTQRERETNTELVESVSGNRTVSRRWERRRVDFASNHR